MLVKGAPGVRVHDDHSVIWLLGHTSSFLHQTGKFSVRWWFPGPVCLPFFRSQPCLTAGDSTDANHSKELWPWTNVIWLSKVHQFFFFFWNSPLITPVQLDPTGGVVGINCLFVCCQVTIPPTPVSGSCYLPLGALQLMWATCCKIQWQSWYICW